MATGKKQIFGRAARAVCLCVVLIAGAGAVAQSRQPNLTPNFGQTGPVTHDKGLEILNDFRSRGIEGDFYFDFQLRLRLRLNSETTVTPGRLWGSRDAEGPITRITLWPDSPGKEFRLLIQNGPVSAIWGCAPGGSASRLDDAMFEPLAGTELTPFDIQMPFVYWHDFNYEGIKPSASNRPAYTFVMLPPPEIVAAHPEITGVRLYIDTAFHAIVKFEILSPGGIVTKTMTLRETPRVNGQYIPGKIEFLDNATRNGTDFVVLLAGVKLNFPRGIFSPSNLPKPLAPPPPETLRKAP